ncbi:hypothetical protein SLS56_000377 [Neofusicoccum ribis]|uniref:ADP-ribosylation factor n=1 Tax=Neofusicoccum ribis TaxID=45134 RepID=A0ABR3TEK9_9PEZI
MLSILRKARLKDKEMRILMLGLDNAGKTTIVKKIMDEDVNSVSPTLGFIIKTIEYEGFVSDPGDVGGQKTLRTYWKNYFEKTDTLIWVVDSTDRQRIDDCRRELKGLLQEEARTRTTLGAVLRADSTAAADGGQPAGLQEQERCSRVNERRRDTSGGFVWADGPSRRALLTALLQGLELDSITTHKWAIMACSAMTGQNLEEGLRWVIQDARDRLFLF